MKKQRRCSICRYSDKSGKEWPCIACTHNTALQAVTRDRWEEEKKLAKDEN